jgi:hypothetical protein
MDDVGVDRRRNPCGCAPPEQLSEPAQFDDLERIAEKKEPEKERPGQSDR